MLQRIRLFWRSVFDIRPGEYGRTFFMALYLMLVLFSYYIVKPASASLFLTRFSISQLPFLTILVAGVGGLLAYQYTRLMVRTSLQKAVAFTSFFSIVMILAIWWLVRQQWPWVIYLFNIWVNIFSIVLVSQGWLVAANVFTPREAKRLYTFLGLGAVAGGAFGGRFTSLLAKHLGTDNLLPASAVMVFLSYCAYWAVVSQHKELRTAKAVGPGGQDFAFHDIVQAIRRHSHLQIIIGIITCSFVINEVIDYQFSAFAKQNYSGDQLTAFLGDFFGVYLNVLSFLLQIFVTGFVVNRFGVGGTLQIMPVLMGLSSVTMLVSPGLRAMSIARLAEASTRYSINRTAMELLYLPLPLELKNRTKAFVDIAADRMARALGGLVLLILATWLGVPPRYLSLVTIVLAGVWLFLTIRAKREYIATVRERLEARRFDLESARITVNDPSTIELLEQTAETGAPRQSAYALQLLADTPHYNLHPLLERLSASPHREVRAAVYDLAASRRLPALLARALADLRSSRENERDPVTKAATRYSLAVSPEARDLAHRLLNHSNYLVIEGAVESLREQPDLARDLLDGQWLDALARSSDPHRRRVAAIAVSVRGDQDAEVLQRLLRDPDLRVQAAAFASAGAVGNRAYVGPIIQSLGNPRLRGAAIDALAAYGDRILGALGDLLADPQTPMTIRRHIPRVLRRQPSQRSVDLLLQHIEEPDLTLRAAVLRALNRLRESAPNLNYGGQSIPQYIWNEARYQYEMRCSLVPFSEKADPHTAVGLLSATLRERLKASLERLFRLLGLQYPPKEIYAAYLAVNRGREDDEYANALEFLETVLQHDVKRFVLPLLEEEGHVVRTGQALFDLSDRDAASALRSLLAASDPWLVSCAAAAAAELGLADLREDIERLVAGGDSEVSAVAQSALERLAIHA